jgi:hypothetical protein
LWENVLKHFFTETTWTIETNLFRNVHLEKKAFLIQFDFGVVVSLTFTPYLIIFIFEHFPIGSNVNLCPAVAAILDFWIVLYKV